ncbi:MAG: ribonuclease BN [Nocardioides sp.]|nr:ribonuclease BN [Nocardioides sp.]
MQQHYTATNAGQQAGAVTYYAFLSFFPVLALAFFIVGLVSIVYPDANQNLRQAIEAVLPGLIGGGDGQISLDDIRTFSGWAGVVGLLGVAYAGLGWVQALRLSLRAVFEDDSERPSFVKAKVIDLGVLLLLGAILVLAVAVTGFVSTFSTQLLDLLEIDAELGWLVTAVSLAIGFAANVVLFHTMFRLLARPRIPSSSLWAGAVLGAVAFEVLKRLSTLLFTSTSGKPAFQAFGIALILLVWINYFTRVVLYAACFACTTRESMAAREAEGPVLPVHGPSTPSLEALTDGGSGGAAGAGTPEGRARGWAAPFAAGGAAMLALVALVRRRS